MQGDNAWTNYMLPFSIRSLTNNYNTLGVMTNGFVVFDGVGTGTCTSTNVWFGPYACFVPGATETATAAIFFDGGWYVHVQYVCTI